MENNPYKPEYKKENTKKEKIQSLGKDMNYMSAGLNILVCFLICGGAGYFADKHFGTEKWTAVGIFAGLAAGFYHFIKFIIDAYKNK